MTRNYSFEPHLPTGDWPGDYWSLSKQQLITRFWSGYQGYHAQAPCRMAPATKLLISGVNTSVPTQGISNLYNGG